MDINLYIRVVGFISVPVRFKIETTSTEELVKIKKYLFFFFQGNS